MSYVELGQEVGQLVADKQAAYGDSFSVAPEILRLLYPEGVRVDQYGDMLTVVRILDKLVRIAKGDKRAFSESPYRDIAGYGLLGMRADQYEADRRQAVNDLGCR